MSVPTSVPTPAANPAANHTANHTLGSSPRRLRWHESRPARPATHSTFLLVAAGGVTLLGYTFATASGESNVGPQAAILAFRDAATVEASVAYRYRLYVDPSAENGQPWQGPPADGLPTDGLLHFRDSDKAWRVESEMDPARVAHFGSLDSSYDPASGRIHHDRVTHVAAVWNDEEASPLLFQQHPLLWMSAWTLSDVQFAGGPTTRNGLRSVADTTLALANVGWSSIPGEGDAMESVTVADPATGGTFVLSAPSTAHDEVQSIEERRPDGTLSRLIRLDDWRIPDWSPTSALLPRTFPHTVTIIGYDGFGTPLYDITLSALTLRIDFPLPPETLKASVEGAETLIDDDTGLPLW